MHGLADVEIQRSPRSDDLDRLEAHIRVRLGGRVRDLRVWRHAEGVVLQGRAFSYYAKQLVQHVVMEMTRLPIVGNEIEVHRPPSPEPDTDWFTR